MPGEAFEDMHEKDINQLSESHNVEHTEKDLKELMENYYAAQDKNEDDNIGTAGVEIKKTQHVFYYAHDLRSYSRKKF